MSESSDNDAVLIERDDISDYNPNQILPESPETIKKIRAWLKPTAYSLKSGEYQKHLASHVRGTGTWLTSSRTYQKWLNDSQHGLLWLKGIPGSGKSVFAATIVDEMSRAYLGSPVLYFFFRQIIDANHQPVALLRDWLDQTLDYSPPLQQQLKLYLESQRKVESMSMEDLWKDLRLAFAGLSRKVFCVADALDEMDRGNDSFLESLAALGQWMPDKVKVLITSRPIPALEVPLRTGKPLQIRLQENFVDVDISLFVQKRLDSSTIDLRDQRLIKEAVPGRANGLFLYAKLAMNAFLEIGANIMQVLQALPSDLNEMYTDLLHEHSRRSGVPDDIQLLILQWVTHATRPLRLLEIAEIINVTYHKDGERDVKATKELVRAAAGPLLEILPDETVYVIHHSLTEYLKGMTRSDNVASYPILFPGWTHAALAVACLQYLKAGCLAEVKTDGKCDDKNFGYRRGRSSNQVTENFQLRLNHPFMFYAMSNWHIHVAKSTNAGYDQVSVSAGVDDFLGRQDIRGAWLNIEWKGSEGVNNLHIGARLGLTEYVNLLLRSGNFDVNAGDANGHTPLWWAADSGHATVVRVLVQAGARADQEESTHGLQPLHQAAEKNHFEVVRALLEAGVDPLTKKTKEGPGRWCGNAPRTKGHTPLMYACHNGHLETLDVFLSFISNINTVHRALNWSAENGHSKLVERILLYPGVDVNAKTRGDTPLFVACGSQDQVTITMLLEANADPSIDCESGPDEFAGVGGWSPFKRSTPGRGFTALHRLCCLGTRTNPRKGLADEDLQRLLSLVIDAGADVNRCIRNGMTPLHGAVNRPVAVKLLLDAGANANAKTDGNDSPLHLCHSPESIALLIENGHAAINAGRSSDGNTPLLSLLKAHNPSALLKLLEYNPDINVRDAEGNGALHIAVKSHGMGTTILRALLAAGGDPNLKNRAGQTPLHLGRYDERDATEPLDILIESGANINAADANGCTLVFQAIRNRPYWAKDNDDLKALVERGACLTTRDFKGRTLLHEAIKYHESCTSSSILTNDNKTTRFDYLVSGGLDVHTADYSGNTLFHELTHPSPQSVSASISPNRISLWKQLIALGVDINKSNNRGRTPLHTLCSGGGGDNTQESGKADVLGFVLSTAEDIDIQDRDGLTPLHLAVTCSEMFSRRLLAAKADAKIATFDGLTPLHLAARSRQSNIVGLLLDVLSESGDKVVSATDKIGRSPLYYACRSGRPESVQMLLDAGVDISNSHVLDACTQFEQEEREWQRDRHPHDSEENHNTGGLTLSDSSRPILTADRNMSNGVGLLPVRDTTSLEAILDMLCAREQKCILGTQRITETGALSLSAYTQSNYTFGCLAKHFRKHSPDGPTQPLDLVGQLTRLSFQLSQQAWLDAVIDSSILKSQSIGRDGIASLLRRREYAIVERVFEQGAERAEEAIENLSQLVRYGYGSLVDRVGARIAETSFADGLYHAIDDKSRPGLHMDVNVHAFETKNQTPPTPLLLTALQRELPNMEVVRLLVEKFHVDKEGWSYNRVYAGGTHTVVRSQSPLHHLAHGFHWWHVALALPYLIRQKASLNLQDNDGMTPLHIALGGKTRHLGPYHREAARLLMKSGADPNAVARNRMTCLAAAGNDVEMVMLLIKAGARISADALFAAIEERQPDVLEALLSTERNANMRWKSSPQPVTAVRPKTWRSVREQSIEAHEWYPLHYAGISRGPGGGNITFEEQQQEIDASIRNINILLAHGADPLAQFRRVGDMLDNTILHELLKNGGLVQPCLARPAIDPNHRDARGLTLLHAACASCDGPDVAIDHSTSVGDRRASSDSLLETLLAVGADPLARDNDGKNAVHHMLAEHEDSWMREPQFMCSLRQLASDHPSLINDRDIEGRTPLLVALMHNGRGKYTTAAQTLVELGADVKVADEAGNTALHYLARRLGRSRAHHKLFSMLIARGLGVNVKNKLGETSIFGFYGDKTVDHDGDINIDEGDMWVALGFRSEFEGSESDIDEEAVMKKVSEWKDIPYTLFEDAGADLFVINEKGQGLLHVAASGPAKNFKRLMERGLDPLLEDCERRTALDIAAACGNKHVLELFKRGDGA